MKKCKRKERMFGAGLFSTVILTVFFLCTILCGAATAKADKVIKIGLIGPLTIANGEQELMSVKLAVEEINEAGGVNVKGVKHKLVLVKADSNEMSSIPDAVSAMERLITVDKVNFVIGGYRTEAVISQMEVVADNKIVHIGGGGSPKLLARVAKNYDRYKYYFMVIHLNTVNFLISTHYVLDSVANKVRAALGIKKPKVAILMDKVLINDPWVKHSKKVFPKMGLELTGVWRPNPFQTDFTAELSAMKSAGTHIVYSVFTGPSGVVFSKQWGESKSPIMISGYNTYGQVGRHWKDTHGMCNYEIVWNRPGRVKITEKTIPFYDKFFKRYGETPGLFSGAYDGMYILKEGIERAGTLESDAVVAAIEKTDYIGAAGRFVITPMGSKSKSPSKLPHQATWGPGYVTEGCTQWRDGKQVPIWPDGNVPMGDERWKGLKYEGTKDIELSPRFLKYWKNKGK